MDSTSELLLLRERPEGKPVLFQTWSELTFVHWKVPVVEVAEKLPEGLLPDLFQGEAYLSFVPFTMSGIRPLWSPTVPGLSAFHEWNLRTYVLGERGPGVWFFSLEASSPVGVAIARKWFGLPYHYGTMALKMEGQKRTYACGRKWPGPRANASRLESEIMTEPHVTVPGTLDFWLAERYLLYARRGNKLWSGRVHHAPYQIAQAQIAALDVDIMRAEGFAELRRPIEKAHFSPGVSVEVFGLQPIR
jgi:uncharacterized protein